MQLNQAIQAEKLKILVFVGQQWIIYHKLQKVMPLNRWLIFEELFALIVE